MTKIRLNLEGLKTFGIDISSIEELPLFSARKTDPREQYQEEWRKYGEEARKRRRIEEERRQRLETLPPEYVVHMVHGTFARKASWIESHSRLSRELIEALGWRAKIEPFHWSGRNGALARWRAALRFEVHLQERIRLHPAAHHIVIAHSHGGNIALWALRDRSLADRVLGVITLSTPFLSARLRPSKGELIDLGTALFAGVFMASAVLFFSVSSGLGLSWWPWAAGIGAGAIAAIIGGGLASEQMRKFAERVCGRMPDTALRPEQVAIVRVQGDEATAAITGVRLAGALGDLLWATLSAPLYKGLNRLLTALDYGGLTSTTNNYRMAAIDQQIAFQELRASLPSEGQGQLSLPLSTEPSPPSWPEFLRRKSPLEVLLVDPWKSSNRLQLQKSESFTQILRQVIVESLPLVFLYLLRDAGTIGRQVAFACGLIYGIPAVLSVAVVILGLPFGVLSAITLLPCGWTLPFAGPYLQLVAEPCPPGSWKVTQFQSGTEQSGLFHSEGYQRYEVSSFIANWIKDRRKAFEAPAVAC
jgi:hypothetical protein